MGILGDEGEPGVEAGSEEAACWQRATKESMKMLQTEERTNERDSRGELGDMGVVAGDGAESQDQEVRAQRCRRELGEEERRHRRRTCVIYMTRLDSETTRTPTPTHTRQMTYAGSDVTLGFARQHPLGCLYDALHVSELRYHARGRHQ